MRVPQRPPPDTFADIIMDGDAAQRDKLLKLISSINAIDEKGRYLHWDDFRRKPTAYDLTSKQAWILTKFARNGRSSKLPFSDVNGVQFSITEVGQVRHRLHEIDSNARGKLTSTTIGTSSHDGKQHFVQALIEEPYSSSVLEGAATTRERAKQMIRDEKPPHTEDDRMVLNNYNALQFIREQKDAYLTPELINDIHKIITDGTLSDPSMAGSFRRIDQDINVEDEQSGERLHTPPSANLLEERIKIICNFANEEYAQSDPFIDPIVRAIVLHFMLAYEHPYVDGNGRTARALFYWYVAKQGYWLLEYISISKILKESPIKYGTAFLHTETDDADLTYFIIHQLEVITRAITELNHYLEAKTKEIEFVGSRLLEMGRAKSVNMRQKEILTTVVRNPNTVLTIKRHQQSTGVTYITARKDLEDLTKEGFLKRSKLGNAYQYRPVKNISVLLGHTT